MSKKYKIAAMGDMESVLGFKAVGFDVYFVEEAEKAAQMLKELVTSEKYAVIFITETLLCKLDCVTDKYKSQPLPAIIGIPDKFGVKGYGTDRIKKSVERAVGADILFKNEI